MFHTISFYSFKGGAGRSTTCLNTIPYLCEASEANANHPIILIDMDLDSAGMTYLLGQEEFFHDNFDVKDFLKGTNDLSVAVEDGLQNHPFYKHLVPVGNRFGLDDNKAVLFLGINDRDKLGNNDLIGETESIFKKLRKFAKDNGISAIAFDTSTGDQISATFSLRYSDTVVCCMKNTLQFRKGTFNFLKRISNEVDFENLILFPTVVPKEDMIIDGKSQFDSSIESILKNIEDLPMDVNKEFISREMFGINEIQRFKWKEDVLYNLAKNGKLNDDEEDAKDGVNRYKKLAEVIIGD